MSQPYNSWEPSLWILLTSKCIVCVETIGVAVTKLVPLLPVLVKNKVN